MLQLLAMHAVLTSLIITVLISAVGSGRARSISGKVLVCLIVFYVVGDILGKLL